MNKRADENVIVTLEKMGVTYEIGASTSGLEENLLFVVLPKPEAVEIQYEDSKSLFGYWFDVTKYNDDVYYEKELSPDEIRYFREHKAKFEIAFKGEFGVVYKRKGKDSLKDIMEEKRKESLKRKLYHCNAKGCSWRGPILSRGLCPYHYALMYNNKKKNTKESPLGVFHQIGNTFAPNPSMGQFFKKHIEILKSRPYSDFKMTPIRNASGVNICHILPKREHGGFPSLGEIDDNILYLTWQQHHDLDKWLDNREYDKLKKQMPEIYEIIIERLPKLLELAEERNKYYFDLKNLLESEQNISE